MYRKYHKKPTKAQFLLCFSFTCMLAVFQLHVYAWLSLAFQGPKAVFRSRLFIWTSNFHRLEAGLEAKYRDSSPASRPSMAIHMINATCQVRDSRGARNR
jgi:predicted RecB family nuclease